MPLAWSAPCLNSCWNFFSGSFKGCFSNVASCFRTYEYMPPELLQHAHLGLQSPYDPQAVDVWSSGVMLTLMLFGKKPFTQNKAQNGGFEAAEEALWWVQASMTILSSQEFPLRPNNKAFKELICLVGMLLNNSTMATSPEVSDHARKPCLSVKVVPA